MANQITLILQPEPEKAIDWKSRELTAGRIVHINVNMFFGTVNMFSESPRYGPPKLV